MDRSTGGFALSPDPGHLESFKRFSPMPDYACVRTLGSAPNDRKRDRLMSQSWKSFLRNHAAGIPSVDLFVVPTPFFKLLYGLVILSH